MSRYLVEGWRHPLHRLGRWKRGLAVNSLGRLMSKRLIGPMLIAFMLGSLPVLVWRAFDRVPPLVFVAYLVVGVASGVTLYLLRPRDDRLPARRLTIFLLG